MTRSPCGAASQLFSTTCRLSGGRVSAADNPLNWATDFYTIPSPPHFYTGCYNSTFKDGEGVLHQLCHGNELQCLAHPPGETANEQRRKQIYRFEADHQYISQKTFRLKPQNSTAGLVSLISTQRHSPFFSETTLDNSKLGN